MKPVSGAGAPAPNPAGASSTPQHRDLYRSAGRVSAAVFLSRITGLVREMVMARLFGAGAVYDAFLLGFRIPNLTRDLFAEGALSSAFVPMFTQYLTTKGKRAAADLSNLVATALIVVVGAVALAGIVFAPAFVRLLAPGFADVPGKFELAVLLTRIMCPFLVLVSLAAQAMGVLNSCGRFGLPAMASTFFNIGSVAIGLALGFTIGRKFNQGLIVSMAIGVVAGGALQLLWQLPSLWRTGFRFVPQWNPRDAGLRQIGRLMLPAMLGNAAVQINVMVNTHFASDITDVHGQVINGPVSWLAYAFRFMQLPLGLFGVAVASATLPSISRSAAVARMDEFGATLTRSLTIVLLLTVPSSVGLAVLGESMIGAVYQWGRFTAFDTHQTAVALAWYSAGLAGYSAIKLLAPAFYAINNSRIPMLVSVGSIAVNLGAAYLLVKRAGMGHAGLALSTSMVAIAGAAVLFALLRRRTNGLDFAKLASSGARILTAASLMGVVCYASSRLVHVVIGAGKLAQLADVAVSIPLGAATFYAAAQLFRIDELKLVREALLPARKS